MSPSNLTHGVQNLHPEMNDVILVQRELKWMGAKRTRKKWKRNRRLNSATSMHMLRVFSCLFFLQWSLEEDGWTCWTLPVHDDDVPVCLSADAAFMLMLFYIHVLCVQYVRGKSIRINMIKSTSLQTHPPHPLSPSLCLSPLGLSPPVTHCRVSPI